MLRSHRVMGALCSAFLNLFLREARLAVCNREKPKQRHRQQKADNQQKNTVRGRNRMDLTERGVSFFPAKYLRGCHFLKYASLVNHDIFRVESWHFVKGKVLSLVGPTGGQLFEQLCKTSIIIPILKIRILRLGEAPGTQLPSTTCILPHESTVF